MVDIYFVNMYFIWYSLVIKIFWVIFLKLFEYKLKRKNVKIIIGYFKIYYGNEVMK